jgi:hypothetical protein
MSKYKSVRVKEYKSKYSKEYRNIYSRNLIYCSIRILWRERMFTNCVIHGVGVGFTILMIKWTIALKKKDDTLLFRTINQVKYFSLASIFAVLYAIFKLLGFA